MHSRFSFTCIAGLCLSTDNTFKVAGKAMVVDTLKARTKIMKGGILSFINEFNEIILLPEVHAGSS